jgi:hypothetical protein
MSRYERFSKTDPLPGKGRQVSTTTLADYRLSFGQLPRWRRKWLVQSQPPLTVNEILISGPEN